MNVKLIYNFMIGNPKSNSPNALVRGPSNLL